MYSGEFGVNQYELAKWSEHFKHIPDICDCGVLSKITGLDLLHIILCPQ